MRFEPDLFDKLFHNSPDSPTVRTLSLEELKNSVAQNIESLLNSRMVFSEEKLAGFEQCEKSVLTYGLEDFTGLSLASDIDRDFICASVEQAIKRHEPRLKEFTVDLVPRTQSISALHFSIKGMLVVQPESIPVSFDAQLQAATRQYTVNRAGGRVSGAFDG